MGHTRQPDLKNDSEERSMTSCNVRRINQVSEIQISRKVGRLSNNSQTKLSSEQSVKRRTVNKRPSLLKILLLDSLDINRIQTTAIQCPHVETSDCLLLRIRHPFQLLTLWAAEVFPKTTSLVLDPERLSLLPLQSLLSLHSYPTGHESS